MPLQADLVQRLLHLVQLERLDDRFDLLHLLSQLHAPTPAPSDEARACPLEAAFMPTISTVLKAKIQESMPI